LLILQIVTLSNLMEMGLVVNIIVSRLRKSE
jgi:hypothetical protein